jgi:hypothetical protein
MMHRYRTGHQIQQHKKYLLFNLFLFLNNQIQSACTLYRSVCLVLVPNFEPPEAGQVQQCNTFSVLLKPAVADFGKFHLSIVPVQ